MIQTYPVYPTNQPTHPRTHPLPPTSSRSLTPHSPSSGLTSIDAARLRGKLSAIGLEVESTAVILAHPSADGLATYMEKSSSGAEGVSGRRFELNSSDVEDAACVLDAPLPTAAVWAITLINFFLAIILSYGVPLCAGTAMLWYANELGACRGKGTFRYFPFKDRVCGCDKDQWGGMFYVMAALPCVLILLMLLTLFVVWSVKWVVIGRYERMVVQYGRTVSLGNTPLPSTSNSPPFLTITCLTIRYKPGVYSVDGPYYLRWAFVHNFVNFTHLFMLPPLRCTGVLKHWYRAMGATIGKGVVLDTTAVYEFDMINIGDRVIIQSDTQLTGHHMKNRVHLAGLLVIGPVHIKPDSMCGPYSFVSPVDPTMKPPADDPKQTAIGTILDGVLPALSSTSHAPRQLSLEQAVQQTVSTPLIPASVQIFGTLVVFILNAIALWPGVFVFYYFLIVPREGHSNPCYESWAKCLVPHYSYAIFHFLWPWTLGVPYALLCIVFKWVVIGRFKPGPTSASLDYRRWILFNLMQSRLMTSFLGISMTSPLISWFYQAMGVKIGRNAQIVPINMIEFDLISIGTSVSFGGQPSIFCRDHAGHRSNCTIGDFSAFTNSSIMMAGSSVGDYSLVGNLTLLPPGFAVPNDSKCVGNPCLVFPGGSVHRTIDQWWSLWIALLHFLGCFLIEAVDQPAWAVVNFGVSYKIHKWYQYGIPGFCLSIITMLVVITSTLIVTVVLLRRCTSRFVGTGARDSWKFVQFTYMTKVIVSTDHHIIRMFNGTPWLSLIYRAMGADVHHSARLFLRHVADFDQFHAGENVIIGFDSYLEFHQKTAFELTFEPIVFGADSVLGSRAIALRGSVVSAGAAVHDLSMVLPGEPVAAGSIWGGLPSKQYFAPSTPALFTSAPFNAIKKGDTDDSVAFTESVTRNEIHGFGGTQLEVDSIVTQAAEAAAAPAVPVPEVVADSMIIIGAGTCGLMAAYEFHKAGVPFVLLEKAPAIGGVWRRPDGAANDTSHVAITEPMYRFPRRETSSSFKKTPRCASDYTSRSEIIEQQDAFVKEHGLIDHILFGAEVTSVCELAEIDKEAQHEPPETSKGGVRVKYNDGEGNEKTIDGRGIFMALGAQQRPRRKVWSGETSFKGTVAYGSAGDVNCSAFAGQRVVIVGAGAFAIENARTALIHGATHVTMVYRRSIQARHI